MIDDISYATVGFTDRNLEEAFDVIAEAGFPQVELTCNPPHVDHPLKPDEISHVLNLSNKSGVRIRTIHAPTMPVALGIPDKDSWKISMAALEKFIHIASDLGATDMVIHPVASSGYIENARNPDVFQEIKNAVPLSLDYLLPIAEKLKVCINLENLPYNDIPYPYINMKELRPLVDQYPSDYLGLILDTGHVGILGDNMVDEITIAGSRLRGTHIHDVNRPNGTDHIAPKRGFLNWESLLQTLQKIQYSGPYTFETNIPKENETTKSLAIYVREFANSWLT